MTARELLALLEHVDGDTEVRGAADVASGKAQPIDTAELEQPFLGDDRVLLIVGHEA
jgi:hypothetical protein